MGKLRPVFNMQLVKSTIENFAQQYDEKSILTLQYLGEEFINKARISGNYTDRTGNLRSSIGYIILNNGEVVRQAFKGSKSKGRNVAQQVAKKVAVDYPEGMVLIGVAGMNYAAAVEHKGYDVITGSAPEFDHVKELLNETFQKTICSCLLLN